jgi:hypothetical protein
MKRVQKKEASDHWILGESSDDLFPPGARLEDEFHHALESRAMDLHQKLH